MHGRNNAKIRDALKSEYADFVNFCKLLDKHYIDELTTSDYIAFRTQHGVTREYISEIQHLLKNYNTSANKLHDKSLPIADSGVEIELDASEHVAPQITPRSKNAESMRTAESRPSQSATREQQGNHEQLTSSDENEIFEDYGSGTNPIDVRPSLYKELGIHYDPSFEYRSIIELGLSLRSGNCLRRNRCHTLNNLFSKNLTEIAAFKDLGKKTLDEIVKKSQAFASKVENDAHSLNEKNKTDQSIRKEVMLSVASAIVRGAEYDSHDLREKEQVFAERLKDACEIIGKEIAQTAIEKPGKARQICTMLSNFYARQEALKECVSYLIDLPKYSTKSKTPV